MEETLWSPLWTSPKESFSLDTSERWLLLCHREPHYSTLKSEPPVQPFLTGVNRSPPGGKRVASPRWQGLGVHGVLPHPLIWGLRGQCLAPPGGVSGPATVTPACCRPGPFPGAEDARRRAGGCVLMELPAWRRGAGNDGEEPGNLERQIDEKIAGSGQCFHDQKTG